MNQHTKRKSESTSLQFTLELFFTAFSEQGWECGELSHSTSH